MAKIKIFLEKMNYFFKAFPSMLSKISNSYKTLNIPGIFIITLGIIFIITLFLYPFIAKQPQKITDLHYDFLHTNTNKSGELYFFIFLTVLGTVFLLYFDTKRITIKNMEEPKGLYIALIVLPLIFNFLIKGLFPPFFLIIGVIFAFTFLIKEQIAIKAVVGYAFVHFACIGIFTFLNKERITEQFIFTISLFIYTFILWKTISTNNENILNKTILFSQIFIPLCLFILLRNEYIYEGMIIKLPFERYYEFIIKTIIIVLIIYSIVVSLLNIKNINIFRKKDEHSIENFIMVTTLCIIAIFRVDIDISKFIPNISNDFWHYGERVIAWQQVIELGQIPYKEFFPPSGLLSIVNGFTLNILFDGTASNISRALTFNQIFYAILITCVFRFSIGTILTMLIMFILPIHMYERYHLMFLSLAILTIPNVRKNINRWLKVWIILII